MSSEENHSPQHPQRLVLSQERVAQEAIAVKELLEVEFEGQVFGPIWRVHLKAHLDAFKQLTHEIRIRDIESHMEWVQVTNHPYFQKRTQTPAPAIPEDQVGNLFYLIQGGQKVGPFTKEQILEKIHAYQLVMTDPISVDMGQNWIKVYQISEFDRRLKSERSNGSNDGEDVSSLYKGLRNNNVVGLQVLQSLTHQDPTNPSYDLDSTRIDPKKKSNSLNDLVELKYFALFIIGLVGIFSILSSWNRPRAKRTPASVKEAKSRQLEQERKANKAAQRAAKRAERSSSRSNRAPASVDNHSSKKNTRLNQVRANNNRRINRPRSRTNRSIRNSAAYKSTRQPASAGEDDNYYDDGDTPDEQDPVRSQVSRETMDPPDEYEKEPDYDKEQNSEDEPYYSPTLKRTRRKRR